jgi:hypothetical protein
LELEGTRKASSKEQLDKKSITHLNHHFESFPVFYPVNLVFLGNCLINYTPFFTIIGRAQNSFDVVAVKN